MLWHSCSPNKTDPADFRDVVTIKAVANLVAEAMESNGEIVSNGSKADDQYQTTSKPTTAIRMGPDFQSIAIRQAIVKGRG